MKSYFTRHYHVLALGIGVIAIVGSVSYLAWQSILLEANLRDQAAVRPEKPYSPPPFSDASAALNHLKSPVIWKPREDGASPYVSRPYLLKDSKLIDPMVSSVALYPPIPNKWLIDHHLDYTDMNILRKDPLRKGFTVLEEFEAGTDPNNPAQFPPLCGKLSYQDSGIRKSSYLLEFLGEEENDGRKEILIKPAQPLANPARGNRPDTSTRGVIRGECIPGAPFLKVIDVEARKKNINDTEYDFSNLILENTLTGERIALIRKNLSREYRKTPIELIESVTFNYQLSGGTPETITVDRGKEFVLTSLEKNHSETYKLLDISKDGVVLKKEGKNFVIKPTQVSNPSITSPSAP